MARKHERFSYSYGWKLAPEQWHFGWNNKPIQLDTSTRSKLAMLIIEGKENEAEAILRKLLRKQEREDSYVCIGFYDEAGENYYFTQDLKCKMDDLEKKLYAYKEWKRYIKERNCNLSTHTVTTGYLTPDGKMTEGEEEEVKHKINLNRPCTIRLVKPIKMKMFQF